MSIPSGCCTHTHTFFVYVLVYAFWSNCFWLQKSAKAEDEREKRNKKEKEKK